MAAPDTRKPDLIRRHYEVEKELADRLRNSTRTQRTELFKSLYNELFERVPDHPRLTRPESPESNRRRVATQLKLLRPHLNPDATLLEFAPGDCLLSAAAAEICSRVIGVDISDQRQSGNSYPENLEHIVYDGYSLDSVPENSVDIVFSYQFLEHLHPDDIEPHFELALKVLKPGGFYVFDTPHRFTGPHDISRYFGTTLDCFHFQEWTNRQMRKLLRSLGFGQTWIYRRGQLRKGYLANKANDLVEAALEVLPFGLRKKLSRRIFRGVTMAAEKSPLDSSSKLLEKSASRPSKFTTQGKTHATRPHSVVRIEWTL